MLGQGQLAAEVKRARWPFYAGMVAAALLIGAFGLIADEMSEGDTLIFDNAVLMAFRKAGNPADPIGPPWLEEAVRDLTSLGSYPVLTLLVVFIGLYLLLNRQIRTALFLTAAVVGGTVVSNVLKMLFGRQRPDLTDLARVFTASFPSGHATTSAVVYLTLGAILAGATKSSWLRTFYLGVAIFLTLLIGITRLYLGVHYPTDVLAGWAIGTAWALLCWTTYDRWFSNPSSRRQKA